MPFPKAMLIFVPSEFFSLPIVNLNSKFFEERLHNSFSSALNQLIGHRTSIKLLLIQ